MPAIIGEHMMIQAGTNTPIYGWAEPGEAVIVTVGESTAATTTGTEGKWKVIFTDLKASATPVRVSIVGKNTITFEDVLIGDVWVCSGQSNMALPVRRIIGRDVNDPKGLGQANYPQMRLFKLPKETFLEPQSDCKGSWVVCTPDAAKEFSATGYFFGREIHLAEKMPVGLINACRGSSSGQMWTSLEALKSEPALSNDLNQALSARANYPQRKERYLRDRAKWLEDTARWPETIKRWEAEVAKAGAEGKALPPKPEPPGSAPARPDGMDGWEDNVMNAPTVLFNGMIAPLLPFGIKGVVWYQGEGNADEWAHYRTLFPAMVRDWRNRWARGDFPVYFVQLSSFGESRAEPGESTWAAFREVQSQLKGIVPNSGMAVTIDIGCATDIHPLTKPEVGRRLSLVALARTYGRPIESSGPLYEYMEVKDNKVVLHFAQLGGGLVAKGGEPLKRFAMAGADKKFVWADAKIESGTVVVSSAHVTTPAAVRYAWEINPEGCNLFNAAGLPASPFRTDDWKLEPAKP
ncbi:MAG: sialate O-acetylesterase [Verrucomicrobiota bacterium]